MINEIVKTYGFHWVILGLFIFVCVVAGFIIFPAFVLTYTWNYVAHVMKIVHTINIFQGILLWGIVSITLYITTKEKFKTSYSKGKIITKNEVKQLIREARKKGIPLKALQSKVPKRHKRGKR